MMSPAVQKRDKRQFSAHWRSAMCRGVIIGAAIFTFCNLTVLPIFSQEMSEDERIFYARARFKEFQAAVDVLGSGIKNFNSRIAVKNLEKDPVMRTRQEEEVYQLISRLVPIVIEFDQQLEDSRPFLKAKYYPILKQDVNVLKQEYKNCVGLALLSLAATYDHVGRPRLGVLARRQLCQMAPENWERWADFARTCYLSGDRKSAAEFINKSLALMSTAM